MPEMDGLAFCRHVLQYSDLPIILLTAVDDEEVMVDAIRHYAEDYLTKPFNFRALEVRVETRSVALATSPMRKATVIVDASLSLDFAHQRVIRGQETIQLTSMETKILHLLILNVGRSRVTIWCAGSGRSMRFSRTACASIFSTCVISSNQTRATRSDA